MLELCKELGFSLKDDVSAGVALAELILSDTGVPPQDRAIA
jgi:hypothetical protein